MEFDSIDGRDDDEYSGVGFVDIFKIFAVQGSFVFGMISFD